LKLKCSKWIDGQVFRQEIRVFENMFQKIDFLTMSPQKIMLTLGISTNMLKLFQKKSSTTSLPIAETPITVQPWCAPSINFNQFVKGIDNVHIDVFLSPHFTELSSRLVYDLLNERSSSKRRSTDKLSPAVLTKIETFGASYRSILTATIYRAKENKRLDLVQLFQVAVIKFLLTTVRNQAERLLLELRKASLKENHERMKLSERIAWLNRYKNNLLYIVLNQLFDQIHWIESGTVGQLRQSLLGVTWSIPKEMLSNPLLQSPETHNQEVLMEHYVLLSQKSENPFSFKYLNVLIDGLLDEISNTCQVQIDPLVKKQCLKHPYPTDMTQFSWKDVPANMEELFDLKETLYRLEQLPEEEHAALYAKQQRQQQAIQILEPRLQQAQVIKYLLAAYETPRLYEYYTKLLEPYLLYQALCDEVTLQEVVLKLQNQLKIRQWRNENEKPLSLNELKKTKKRLAKLVRSPDRTILKIFVTDFVAYRRDLKYLRLTYQAMEQIHTLTDEEHIQLSQSNGLLHEFFEQDEQSDGGESIRCHVILKADLRGSTTMTAALKERDLNPATHFSLNFFNPIRQLIKDFGAEKVFIEGDAIILSFFEYKNDPKQWFAATRACGLARSMLAVVKKQNDESRVHKLPQLELGIGICYSSEAPDFLYDGEQRIMISPAIGDADRLSSCSWKLRRKYAYQPNLLINVMVFQQPANDAFLGEKGMTTFRYNLNGIELDPVAFKKLQSEVALRQFKIRLPGDEESTRFYAGYFSDTKGEKHEVVIREGRMKVWQEDGEDYPITDSLYYEVVTNKTIISTIKKQS